MTWSLFSIASRKDARETLYWLTAYHLSLLQTLLCNSKRAPCCLAAVSGNLLTVMPSRASVCSAKPPSKGGSR